MIRLIWKSLGTFSVNQDLHFESSSFWLSLHHWHWWQIDFIPILTGGGDSTEAITSSLEEAVSSITNESPPPTAVTPDVALIPGAGEPITSTSRNVEIQLPTPTLTRPDLPATLESINLRLDITERAWMRVTIDDEVVFEGQAQKGDGPFEWEAQETAELLSGNAAGVFVTINNVELGKLGGAC